MKQCRIENMYDLSETIAADYMKTAEYPWELLEGLSEYIKKKGASLDRSKRKQAGKSGGVSPDQYSGLRRRSERNIPGPESDRGIGTADCSGACGSGVRGCYKKFRENGSISLSSWAGSSVVGVPPPI